MRLLVTVPWKARLGGAETMLWRLLTHMDYGRFETTVVFFEAGPFEAEVAALPHLRTVVIPVGRLRQLGRTARAVGALAAVMRDREPELILNWAASAQIYGALAASRARMPDRLVWWQHAIPSGHRMERAATLLPARAVGCSSSVAAAAQARMRPHRTTFIVHPGTSAELAQPVARAELGIPENRVVIGIVGRLQPWKGQHRFLQALTGLRKRGRDVHGLIVGGDAHGLSPEYAPQIESQIRESGMSDVVTLTGHVADPLPYIAAMDVLVNASIAEPFGIVVIEGMSQGVAVVAARDGGARDILDDRVSGLLVDRAEPRRLEEALDTLVSDPELRSSIAAGGRRAFEAHFTTEIMAGKLQSRLESLAPQPRSRSLVA
jgi:glycosyltransferase involved in cell wall biosynthesis